MYNQIKRQKGRQVKTDPLDYSPTLSLLLIISLKLLISIKLISYIKNIESQTLSN